MPFEQQPLQKQPTTLRNVNGGFGGRIASTKFDNEYITQDKLKEFDNQYEKIDPTVKIFNRMFTHDTHKLLGLSGIKVSRITLGSMNFGPLDPQFGERQGQLDENQAHQILDRYVELGGNCIETANFFPWFGKTSGESERIIGNWLVKRSDRERLVIISKICLPTDPTNVNSIGLSRSNVINSVENILRRLQTNYIDLLQIDGWDYTVHVNEIIRVYDELLMSGKVRNFGVCDFKAWQLQNIIDKSKMLNKHRIASYQGEYSLLSRGSEMEVVDVCLNHGLGFIAYSPFKYGFLTDTYANQTNIEQPEQGTRLESTAGPHTNLSSMGEPFELAKYNPAFKNLFCALKCIAKNRSMSFIYLFFVFIH
jgi:aryl-alcohol dehydrogenase-like predicted oxidoreductase